MRDLTQSEAWWKRAAATIPLGTQTLSKTRSQFVQGVAPIFLQSGRGAHVWDVDGNEYVDTPMALGPVMLGYAEPVVDDAIRRQLEQGIVFTLAHPLEVEVAERIVSMCPGVEAVRFGKTGSDALTAAVRAARAHTGRDLVLVAGYHGWHDWYIGSTSRSAGVPHSTRELIDVFRFNDVADLQRALQRHAGRVAAIVLEPAAAESPVEGFLESVIELARAHGAVSVFDEIVTGFRLAPGGAREYYGVQPDLSCYGKALGNGMPISAVAGSWTIMRRFEEVFFSGTHGGETLSLAAAAAVLDTVRDGSVAAAIGMRGARLAELLSTSIARHRTGSLVRVTGEPHRLVIGLTGDDMVRKSWIQQCMLDAGVLYNGVFLLCARHDDADIDRIAQAFDLAMSGIADQEDLRARLRGEPVQPVFRPV